MFSVIFEVLPNQGKKDEYLELVKHLKPILGRIAGFIDNERFESQLRPGWVLSHSTWRDEKSVVRWRTGGEHHVVQAKGRSAIFADYHLRVGDVTADSIPSSEAPVAERRFDETEVGKAKMMTFTELFPAKGANLTAQLKLLAAHLGLDVNSDGCAEYDIWASIYNPGKLALLVGWDSAKAAEVWQPRQIDGIDRLRHRKVRVIRDYGRFDRREAPQFYPDVQARQTLHPEPARPKD